MPVTPCPMPAARTSQVALLAMIALLGVSCAKKPPKTPADLDTRDTATTSPARESASASSPTALDPDADLWSRSLEEINRYVREQGLLADVYFDFDRADLRNDTRDRLARNAKFLTERKDFEIMIEGHCDERGTSEYNLVLGENRARAAQRYMVSMGVAPERIQVVTYGEERPVCRESDESCWWQNRRAHFYLSNRSGH